MLNSVLRTQPVKGGPEPALWHDDFAIRKRQDGGFTIVSSYENIVDIVPDSFRHARAFLPALRQEWRSLSFLLGRRFRDEARLPRRWGLDRPSPFETCRVLDPEPNRSLTDRAIEAVRRAFPLLKSAQVRQVWAGYIDVTPDALPVISALDQIPGFFLPSGFSGHGFGIGPAAGKIMADLVTRAAPFIDPAPFRFSRFSDNSRIELISGF